MLMHHPSSITAHVVTASNIARTIPDTTQFDDVRRSKGLAPAQRIHTATGEVKLPLWHSTATR